MTKAVAVELECTSCGSETVHQATIVDGRLDSFRCVSCNSTTYMPAPRTAEPAVPGPLSALEIDRLELGLGHCILEGGIELPPGTLLQQGLAAVRAGHALNERDCRVLRLHVTTPAQVALADTLRASTGLPVLIDIGTDLALAPEVGRSQADGLIFTCLRPEDAEVIGSAVSPAYRGVVVIRTAGPDSREQVRTASSACQRLCRWHHRHLAVTLQAPDAPTYAIMASALHEQVQVPLRAELPMAGRSSDVAVSTAAALGVALAAQGTGMVSLPALSSQTAPVYDAALEALSQLEPGQNKDMLGTLVYMAGKALTRVATKPRRVLHEMERAPSIFARSLPSRVMSKPQRVMGEIRRLMRKSG